MSLNRLIMMAREDANMEDLAQPENSTEEALKVVENEDATENIEAADEQIEGSDQAEELAEEIQEEVDANNEVIENATEPDDVTDVQVAVAEERFKAFAKAACLTKKLSTESFTFLPGAKMSNFSLESYSYTSKSNKDKLIETTLAMESIVQNLKDAGKTVWNAIIEFFRNIILKIKNLFKNKLQIVAESDAYASKLTEDKVEQNLDSIKGSLGIKVKNLQMILSKIAFNKDINITNFADLINRLSTFKEIGEYTDNMILSISDAISKGQKNGEITISKDILFFKGKLEEKEEVNKNTLNLLDSVDSKKLITFFKLTPAVQKTLTINISSKLTNVLDLLNKLLKNVTLEKEADKTLALKLVKCAQKQVKYLMQLEQLLVLINSYIISFGKSSSKKDKKETEK